MIRSSLLIASVSCTALLSSTPSFAEAGNNENCICSPEQTSKAFTAVAKKSIPAVVFIKVQSNSPDMDENGYPYGYQNPFENGDDFFHRFFGMPFRGQPQKPSPQLSQGSGFIVSADRKSV